MTGVTAGQRNATQRRCDRRRGASCALLAWLEAPPTAAQPAMSRAPASLRGCAIDTSTSPGARFHRQRSLLKKAKRLCKA